MRRAIETLTALTFCAATWTPAATHYVDLNSANPIPPYLDWATAATNIQDAVDMALGGEQVVVTNGLYSGGIRLASSLALLSVSGPRFTVIDGRGAMQCVALSNNTKLFGFTLTNGVADYGGGAWCESASSVLTNCILTDNSALSSIGEGGGAHGGTLFDCTLIRNAATYGGGSFESTLYNCTLSANSSVSRADNGGGTGGAAYRGTFYNCRLISNVAPYGGGVAYSTLYDSLLISNMVGSGAYAATLYRCTLIGNSSREGGGADDSILTNCILIGNMATNFGGGASWGRLDNCTLIGNSARSGGGAFHSALNSCLVLSNSAAVGGGAYAARLQNCTVIGNLATQGGGIAFDPVYPDLTFNSIVYLNTASQGQNYGTNIILNYCCTMPLPTTGRGNIAADPQFVDFNHGNLRLQPTSPCIDVGYNVFVSGASDFDGRPRITGPKVDMGAYEFQPGASGTFIEWLQGHGLPRDGSVDFLDTDADGRNNWQEWICDTDPTNALSVLKLLSPAADPSGVSVTWQTVTNRAYTIERSTDLATQPAFTLLATGIAGQPGTTTFVDTNALGPGPFYYRVRAEFQ